MKACVMQPPYSRDTGLSDSYFAEKLKMLDQCGEDMDIIVLPEYSDVPCVTATREDPLFYHNKYIGKLLDKCVETAKRCGANVFVNALSLELDGYRNTTYCYNKSGELLGKYFKRHLPPLELNMGLDSAYTQEAVKPFVLEMDGLRYGFLTCYDFYFYEAYAAIARQNVDVIIGCSHQRTDTHEALSIICKFLCYQTNAYLVRASVSLGKDSCGLSFGDRRGEDSCFKRGLRHDCRIPFQCGAG